MASLRSVTIVVTGTRTGDTYLARSYPDDDFNDNGKVELYRVPVYRIDIKGTDGANRPVTLTWKGLRFMPYWNNPKKPDPHYRTLGWANAGLRSLPKKAVEHYNPNYGTQNRYSPYAGAIQLRNSFLIHAGPQTLTEIGWGSAGCVEIVGDFDKFKANVKTLSGSNNPSVHGALTDLVRARQLFVQVDPAAAPNIAGRLVTEVVPSP